MSQNFVNLEQKHLVAIIMGSKTDSDQMLACHQILNKLEIPHLAQIISAHRLPEQTAVFAKTAQTNGYEVIIAGAGASAALPGALAAHTCLPVIGVPLNTTSLGGLDALLSISQMPANVPVATMAIGQAGAKNAAILAARILALKYTDINQRLKLFSEEIYNRACKDSTINPFFS